MMKFLLIAAFIACAAAVMQIDDDAHAKVNSDIRENDGKGHFHYGFETSNGMGADEEGDEKSTHGEYHYISKEGLPIKVTYTADENGYHPQGELLPTPPPVPAYILKALEYIRTHPPKEENNNKKN